MTDHLDQYLVLNESAMDAYRHQMYPTEKKAIKAAREWSGDSKKTMYVFRKVVIVEQPNMVAKLTG